MGKTLKDKANYFKHHLAHDNPYAIQKEKHKIPEGEIPKAVKAMVEKLSYRYNTALRHGVNRNMHAEAKVIERRHERARGKKDLLNEVKNSI